MVAFVWEFVARDNRVAEFEHAYSSAGAWAQLFAKAADFRGTWLLRDSENTRRFLTMDRWQSVEAQSERFAREYQELDRDCKKLTESEHRIGIFEEPGPIVRKSA
jgi:hypothetical protein